MPSIPSLCRLAVLMLGVVACSPDDTPTAPSTSQSPRRGYDVSAAVVATPAVDAGSTTTCAIRAEGSIVCWGSDAGWGLTTPPAGAFSQFDMGSVDACGVTSAGAVKCWGASGWGQRQTLPGLPAGLTYRQVGVGVTSVCAVRSDASLVCWADTRYGVGSAPAGTFTQVGVGHKHACAISTTGALACWGTDEYGTLTAVPSAPAGRRFTAGRRGGAPRLRSPRRRVGAMLGEESRQSDECPVTSGRGAIQPGHGQQQRR